MSAARGFNSLPCNPSTIISLEAKNEAISAISSGIPIRLIAEVAIVCALPSSERNRAALRILSLANRYDEQGKERTIFRCAWCEAPFSVDVENIDQVRVALIAMKPRDQWDNPDFWWDKVAHRIMPNQQE